MTLDNEFLNNIKNHLQSELTRIKKRLASLSKQDPFSDPDRLIDNAASDAEANEETSHDRVEAIENELKINKAAIEEAIERISKNTYGICKNCGREIDRDRLSVNPTALYCLDCEKSK
ncbi:hypothetical protein A2773_02660 [Candidatus Gottesmanbacteria bacterium RIFCSPHIGHO2_01_FULL_39_10]|uniref:Zinc finger DksA/TraR C4-type domain-containing protein n=1 Tax=Candidatus Gottesmanbacteria bacterium RIFCSPHIGHO2_01_FULL_39_10 TaxID=1798375 RepID=A0A1F5ZRD8_9BACT|nr:MAG: hypothetical protein A2773_02660 [Candidatus Gottesmanbacteria bacterium RIFCSPHIGHO2_01_FULL_39_10]